MGKKELIDACKDQFEFAYKMHNDRRQWEWKITIGFWAIIVATVTQHITLSPIIWWATVFVYAMFWLRPLWIANQNNKNWYDHYKWECARLISDSSKNSVKLPPVKLTGWKIHFGFIYRNSWSFLFQLATTILLAYIATQFNNVTK